VLTLRREPAGARFTLGTVTVTPGALAALAEAAQHTVEFLVRHVRGDWGAFGQCDQIQLSDDERRRGWEATDDTAKINKWNVLNGQDTVMSEYVTAQGKRIWVVTRLDRGNGTKVGSERYTPELRWARFARGCGPVLLAVNQKASSWRSSNCCSSAVATAHSF
jgi:hypothetical protein